MTPIPVAWQVSGIVVERLKTHAANPVFRILRGLESGLPADAFHTLLRPLAAARALPRRFTQPAAWPACLGPRRPDRTWQNTARYYLNRVPAFFPDRLATEKWRDRCEVRGLEPLLAARHAGRPVVLAFCHFGPILLSALWLRAHGIPATTLVRGHAGSRSTVKRLKDRVLPFPDIPVTVYTEPLRDAIALLSRSALLVAIDVLASKLIEVPAAPGWNFRLPTGPLRLAAQHDAVLLPCTIVETGPWRFRLELGRPVPDDLLREGPDFLRAGQHLVGELVPLFQRHPDHCSHELIKAFRPADRPPGTTDGSTSTPRPTGRSTHA